MTKNQYCNRPLKARNAIDHVFTSAAPGLQMRQKGGDVPAVMKGHVQIQRASYFPAPLQPPLSELTKEPFRG